MEPNQLCFVQPAADAGYAGGGMSFFQSMPPMAPMPVMPLDQLAFTFTQSTTDGSLLEQPSPYQALSFSRGASMPLCTEPPLLQSIPPTVQQQPTAIPAPNPLQNTNIATSAPSIAPSQSQSQSARGAAKAKPAPPSFASSTLPDSARKSARPNSARRNSESRSTPAAATKPSKPEWQDSKPGESCLFPEKGRPTYMPSREDLIAAQKARLAARLASRADTPRHADKEKKAQGSAASARHFVSQSPSSSSAPPTYRPPKPTTASSSHQNHRVPPLPLSTSKLAAGSPSVSTSSSARRQHPNIAPSSHSTPSTSLSQAHPSLNQPPSQPPSSSVAYAGPPPSFLTLTPLVIHSPHSQDTPLIPFVPVALSPTGLCVPLVPSATLPPIPPPPAPLPQHQLDLNEVVARVKNEVLAEEARNAQRELMRQRDLDRAVLEEERRRAELRAQELELRLREEQRKFAKLQEERDRSEKAHQQQQWPSSVSSGLEPAEPVLEMRPPLTHNHPPSNVVDSVPHPIPQPTPDDGVEARRNTATGTTHMHAGGDEESTRILQALTLLDQFVSQIDSVAGTSSSSSASVSASASASSSSLSFSSPSSHTRQSPSSPCPPPTASISSLPSPSIRRLADVTSIDVKRDSLPAFSFERKSWPSSSSSSSSTTQPTVVPALTSPLSAAPTASRQPKRPGTSLISQSFVDKVLQSRDDYRRYVAAKESAGDETFDHWQINEALTNDLLDEMLYSIADELANACNGYVDGIVQAEFLPCPESDDSESPHP